MARRSPWCRVLSLAIAAIAIWRLWEAFGLAVIAATAPVAGGIAVAGQGFAALIAAIALWRRTRALGRAALAAFVAFVLLQMGVDTFGYGVRSMFEALAWTLLAFAVAGIGWVVLSDGRWEGPVP